MSSASFNLIWLPWFSCLVECLYVAENPVKIYSHYGKKKRVLRYDARWLAQNLPLQNSRWRVLRFIDSNAKRRKSQRSLGSKFSRFELSTLPRSARCATVIGAELLKYSTYTIMEEKNSWFHDNVNTVNNVFTDRGFYSPQITKSECRYCKFHIFH